jgi:hypothetical protein
MYLCWDWMDGHVFDVISTTNLTDWTSEAVGVRTNRLPFQTEGRMRLFRVGAQLDE